MLKQHFLCKEWKTLSEQKLIIFTDEISTLYQEIFPEFASPAQKPEANSQDFYTKQRNMNYKGKTDPKFTTEIGFVCHNVS